MPTDENACRKHKHMIEASFRTWESSEKPIFDNLLTLYRGEMWAKEGPLSMPNAFVESEMLRSSTNLVFAIVETARSVLCPPNPKITIRDGGPTSGENARLIEESVNMALSDSGFPGELITFVEDMVLFGRGVLKVGWDTTKSRPWAKTVDLNALVFDREAKRASDIRWWCESTLLSPIEWKRRLENKDMYAAHAGKLKEIRPGLYPSWLKRQDKAPTSEEIEQASWYVVYEFYDSEGGKVYHYVEGCEEPILEDELTVVPYVLKQFNSNKLDCGGLSEILLIASNQAELNVLSSMLLEIIRKSIPTLLFDKGRVSSDDIEAIQSAPIGAYVGVSTIGDNATLANSLYPSPSPQAPNMLAPLIDKQFSTVQFVSALADAQRGQVTGAKTATELALLDSQLKTRLASRQRVVDSAIRDVAELFFYLLAQYLDDSRAPQVLVGTEWVEVTREKLNSNRNNRLEVVPYNATPTNREVQRERFATQVYPVLAADPLFDQRKVRTMFLEVMELPLDLLAPEAPPAPPAPTMAAPAMTGPVVQPTPAPLPPGMDPGLLPPPGAQQ